MIFPRNCYFYCDTEAEVMELLQMLEQDGLRWASGQQLTSNPLRYDSRTYYRVPKDGRITYGNKLRADADWEEYSLDDARRFYAGDVSSCEVSDINDLL